MTRFDKLQSEGVDSSQIDKLLNTNLDKKYLGRIGEDEFVFYSEEYDQVYIYDILSDIGKTLTLEEYENLVILSSVIENIFKENEKKGITKIDKKRLCLEVGKEIVVVDLPEGSIDLKGKRGFIEGYNAEIEKYEIDFGNGWIGHLKEKEFNIIEN
jgi:GGDEF domain-containing protein